MISGTDILESSLHLNLIEHLNSEIDLQTVNSLDSARSWLEGTFLSVRMRLNPGYYRIDNIVQGGDTDHRLKLVCERDIKLLQEHELVTRGDAIKCTDYGQAMSRYMVSFETMKLLLSIPEHAKTEEIVSAIFLGIG
jgi:ATP-dependent DNA helicase HFM1/MER3